MTPVRNPAMPVLTPEQQTIADLRLNVAERDKTIAELNREVGSREEQQKRLTNEVLRLQRHIKDKFETYGNELVEWCWDQVTNDDGKQVKFTVDAALGGEEWIPSVRVHNGKRISIIETVYEVSEV
jgi:uncharacterized coiled-coil protein SlyX